MKRLTILLFSIFVLDTFANAQFTRLKCQTIISDTWLVTVKGDSLQIDWTNRGAEGTAALLRAMAHPAIPLSLLKEYGHLEIKFEIPIESCDFSNEIPGTFKCDLETTPDKTTPIVVDAKVSPYSDTKPDRYTGQLSRVKLSSKIKGKQQNRFIQFLMDFEVLSPQQADVSTSTDSFFAHYWQSEGFGQNPSCQVDGEFLVIE